MLCRLTNIGAGVRIVHDMNSVPRRIEPGASVDVDLVKKVAVKYFGAMSKGQDIQIVALDDDAELKLDDPAESSAPEGHSAIQEPESLKEALGLQGNQPPPVVAEAIQEAANRPNPAEHAARMANTPAPPPRPPQPEPKTASDLLAVFDTLGDDERVRLARTVLDKPVPKNARAVTILQMLTAQARRDVAAATKVE